MSRSKKWRRGGLLGLVISLAFMVTPALAQAAGPTAIGQDSQGISYVGYGNSGTISRYDSNGNPLSSWSTSSTEIVAISVDPSGNVWVLDPAYVTEYSSTGTQLAHFEVELCSPHGGTLDPSRYGGLAVTSTAVYVGSPCFQDLYRYSRTGTLQQTQTLPGQPRGVAIGPAGGNTNQVFVAIPDQHEVLTYDGNTFASNSAEPPLTVSGSGSTNWTPSGVAVKNDSGGDELIVSDTLNDYLYVYDPGHLYGPNGTYSSYRTLGHGQGSAAGSVDDPTAIALHPADGSGLDSNLFIADYNNNRIQRWNDSGYTWWTAAAAGPATSAAPADTALPAVVGNPVVGTALTCSNGTWTGSSPITYTYAWQRNGTQIATGQSYTVATADVGQSLTCTVTATNSAGSASATSGAVTATAATSTSTTIGVSVNNAAIYTNTAAVTVTVVAPAGTTSVLLSNDGGFANAKSFPVAANNQYSWTLQTSGTERLPKVVYARFVGAGSPSYLTLSDDIILDTTAPTVQSATVSTAARTALAARVTKAKTGGYLLTVRAKDAISGVGKLEYKSSAKAKKFTTVKYAKSIRIAKLNAAVYVRAVDKAGNVGKWVKVTKAKPTKVKKVSAKKA